MVFRRMWCSGPLVALLFVVCCLLGVEGEKDYYDILGVGSGERERERCVPILHDEWCM